MLGVCSEGYETSENHTVVQAARNLKGHLHPTPLPWHRGKPSTRPGCKKPHPSGLEYFQAQGIHSLSRQPAAVPHSEEPLPYI